MMKVHNSKALRERRPVPRHVIISKWENTDVYLVFTVQMVSQITLKNVMESMLGQDPFSYFVHEGPISSGCVIQ